MERVEITKASEDKVREIEWLWYPYIPFGKITVVQGDAGDGKSTFVLNLAAMLSRGQPMPFTDGTGQPVGAAEWQTLWEQQWYGDGWTTIGLGYDAVIGGYVDDGLLNIETVSPGADAADVLRRCARE